MTRGSATVRADNLPVLHAFTDGLKKDYDDVTAGLTLPYGNGIVVYRMSAYEQGGL